MAFRSVDDWIARLQPALEQPVRQLEALLNADADLQQWLQEAAFRAAMEASWSSDSYALGAAYQRLQDELSERFSALEDAVRRLTHGCGRLRLNWQPDAPHYSRVEIDFGRDYSVDLFVPLPDASLATLRQALERLRQLLPVDAPYPRRPHQATAILAFQGRCPALRLLDHLMPSGRRQTAIVLLPDQQPSSEMAPEQALRLLQDYFSGSPESG